MQWDKHTHYVYGLLNMNGGRKKVYLHRWITDAPKGKVVDHYATHDGTDNRRSSNLQIVTQAVNTKNKRDQSTPYGSSNGDSRFIMNPHTDGETLYWAVSYVNGVYLRRYPDYADALFAQYIGNAVMSNVTDEELLKRSYLWDTTNSTFEQ